MTPPRLRLAHVPTPLAEDARLSAIVGADVFVKRDDATGGAEAGNKVRKLEFILKDALDRGARHIVTCGGIQSNHARATAILSRRLGLECTLLLRVTEGATSGPDHDAAPASLPRSGNVLLDRLVGAHIRTITPNDYARRTELMAHAAKALGGAYVIPEGGSNGLGAFGYVEAMREVADQMQSPFDVVVHACGSGGTAAGVALGCGTFGVAARVRAIAVCDDAAYFERVIASIIAEATAIDARLESATIVVDDRSKGPRYGVMDDDQRALLVRCAREAGVLLDPVYTGKAIYGLRAAVERGDIATGARVLFIHTGGLPGLLSDSDALGELA